MDIKGLSFGWIKATLKGASIRGTDTEADHHGSSDFPRVTRKRAEDATRRGRSSSN